VDLVAPVSDADLRELIALFKRYNVSMKQLGQLKTDKNQHWFEGNETAYWHLDVFT